MKKSKIKKEHLIKHETKRQTLIKFIVVAIIFLIYFGLMIAKYGLEKGLPVTILTWSFFVICTPIADAGFLIDFPLRLITNVQMFLSEFFVWLIAIGVNFYFYFLYPQIYQTTKLLSLFKRILSTPMPFYGIILLSAIGTFVSVKFGDELLDEINHKDRKLYHKHKHKYSFLVMIFIFALAFVLYDFLLKKLGVQLLF